LSETKYFLDFEMVGAARPDAEFDEAPLADGNNKVTCTITPKQLAG